MIISQYIGLNLNSNFQCQNLHGYSLFHLGRFDLLAIFFPQVLIILELYFIYSISHFLTPPYFLYSRPFQILFAIGHSTCKSRYLFAGRSRGMTPQSVRRCQEGQTRSSSPEISTLVQSCSKTQRQGNSHHSICNSCTYESNGNNMFIVLQILFFWGLCGSKLLIQF